ncbi:type II secretion system F family protein [Candidatus Woesearchaeota archaeon]|nr:type II secretion system F family protein [Candidatus Woesearchaeota archaeon]
MSIINNITSRHPDLKRKLYMAGMDVEPRVYVKEKFKNSLLMGFLLLVGSFFLIDKNGGNLFLVPIIGVVTYALMFRLQMRQVDAKISKRAGIIDKDVLFAGRFLLVKLNSGRPLINAIEDATKSYGISNEYFKEIIKDIDLGTSLEDALEKATTNCPSKKLKKILFQITNALKIGTDVTNFLESILDEIAEEQLIEIQRYGKKLSSVTMFFMLIAVVLPSLGMTMIVVIISLINITLSGVDFMLIILGLMFIQFIFLTTFKSIRPNVNI